MVMALDFDPGTPTHAALHELTGAAARFGE
ncbi:hypothetical protein ABIA39_008386 [Nocardia sp. GAS34]